jgi:AraC family transcriptional regulator, regulatory protein of adaptative response / methylated-DNA-[protein]-cysteine methyltransferase
MENELFWQAVRSNDHRFDGAFFFGVKTTGIYCKPSCTAKLPKRENVEFYVSADAAERSGFRACLRCRPRDASAADPQTEKIISACSLMDSEDGISLKDLSLRLGVSPSHFQRSFKRLIGLSPKKYAEVKRMDKFKKEIRGGSDIVTAMYDTGFGSSSRLYEKADSYLGMTPTTYKKGGEGMKISYTITECELGRILVAGTIKGLCSVAFDDDDLSLEQNLMKEYPNAEIVKDARILSEFVEEIIKHLAGLSKRLDLPLDIQATAFQMQVWELLRKIPFGETMSYMQIAEKLGDRKKVRAVARACATNRVAIVIPCHRVVASDGKLSGYRWGVERKKRILDREKVG